MLKSSRIPLAGDSGVVTVEGAPVAPSRTVEQEIARLRALGAHDAANRLESGCDDIPVDHGVYPEIDPTDKAPKDRKFVPGKAPAPAPKV